MIEEERKEREREGEEILLENCIGMDFHENAAYQKILQNILKRAPTTLLLENCIKFEIRFHENAAYQKFF